MLEQYNTVIECLSELQRSNLPIELKLKMEVQLYHLKRILLLEEVAVVVKDDSNNKKEFMELHDIYKHVCTISSNDIEIKKLVTQQTEIKRALYALARSENASAGRG